MIKLRVIDTDGKDEVHTLVKLTYVTDRLWCYTQGTQYYIPTDIIHFMQVWEE